MLIRPVLIYGSETWITTEQDKELLIAFERNVLDLLMEGSINRTFGKEDTILN